MAPAVSDSLDGTMKQRLTQITEALQALVLTTCLCITPRAPRVSRPPIRSIGGSFNQYGRVSDSWNYGRECDSGDNGSMRRIAPRSGLRLSPCHEIPRPHICRAPCLHLPCVSETPRPPIRRMEGIQSHAGQSWKLGY